MQKAPKQILILGIGNILLKDEGFGVHAIEHLGQNYEWPENVRLLDGGTRGLLLMSDIMECDQLVVLDIMAAGGKPGTIYLVEDEDLRARLGQRQSMHQTSITDVLASCELAGHLPRVLVFALEPYDWQAMDVNLSPQAAASLPEFCDKLVNEMRGRGLI